MGQSARLCLGPALSGAQYFYQQLVEVARDRRSKRSWAMTAGTWSRPESWW